MASCRLMPIGNGRSIWASVLGCDNPICEFHYPKENPMAEAREFKLTLDASEFTAALDRAVKAISEAYVKAQNIGHADTHGPHYKLTYIESTIQRLANRGLTITPVDVLTGILKLNAAGIEGSDAETALYAFIERLSPYMDKTAGPTFLGWEHLAAALAGKSNEDLAKQFGMYSLRVASLIRGHIGQPDGRDETPASGTFTCTGGLAV